MSSKVCSACSLPKAKPQFSKTQWAKGDDRRCAECVNVVVSQPLAAMLGALDVSDASRDDDTMSVATSAVTIESTQHLREREAERGIDRRELQSAIKHGTCTMDEATGHLQYRHNGVCYVTDATGKVGITSWVEDASDRSVTASERSVTITFMQCSGKLKQASCKAHEHSAAMAEASRLLRQQIGSRAMPAFQLLLLKTNDPLPASGAQPGEEYVILLLGPHLDISPLAQESRPGEHMLSGAGFADPKSYAWKTTRSPIKSDVFRLAMQLSLGLSVMRHTENPPLAPSTYRDDTGMVSTDCSDPGVIRRASAFALIKQLDLDCRQGNRRLVENLKELESIKADAELEQYMMRCRLLLEMEAMPPSSPEGEAALGVREHLETYDHDWAQPHVGATIAGLTRRPELNNKYVELLKFDRSAGRWEVRSDETGGIVRVKAANLHPWPPLPPGADVH